MSLAVEGCDRLAIAIGGLRNDYLNCGNLRRNLSDGTEEARLFISAPEMARERDDKSLYSARTGWNHNLVALPVRHWPSILEGSQYSPFTDKATEYECIHVEVSRGIRRGISSLLSLWGNSLG
jgi:hypothetical protein